MDETGSDGVMMPAKKSAQPTRGPAMPEEEKTEMDKRVQSHELEVSGEQSLPPEVQASIGRQLKRAYADIVAEPLPDRFSKLLDELAQANKKSGDKS